MVNLRAPLGRRLLWGYFAAAPAVCLAVQLWSLPGLWTFWLGVNLLVAVTFAAVVFVRAARVPNTENLLLALASAVSIGAGARDWLYYRLSSDAYGAFSVSRYASLFFILVMAWILVDRFARALGGYAQLNRDLANRVAEKERQLREQFERAQARERETAIAEERSRIMRDMHDGLGARLVSVLHMAEQPQASGDEIARQVRHCLDDLRLTIDSMEAVEGDLATVLGHLRYRFGSRLTGVGVDLDWQVEELPKLAYLTPEVIRNIQKVALEAIANVLKHARASRVTVRAFHDAAAEKVVLELRDNGGGFEAGATPMHGHGLANMRHRAARIGGVLELSSGANGTTVRLEMPCPP